MPQRRYAIYYAPEPGSDLDRFGAAWLGRDVHGGQPAPQPALDGFPPERQREITAEARRYGFHGTLKPPFVLTEGQSAGALYEAVGAFAAACSAFAAPPLTLAAIGGFLALIPSAPCRELHDLAAGAVRALDPFRAPPPPAELARRRAADLTERQERYLQEWGYPYVLDAFRFHLTLTARLADGERGRVARLLRPLTAPLCRDPLEIASVWVFEQESRDADFVATRRFALG